MAALLAGIFRDAVTRQCPLLLHCKFEAVEIAAYDWNINEFETIKCRK
jgi:hypothetical protein